MIGPLPIVQRILLRTCHLSKFITSNRIATRMASSNSSKNGLPLQQVLEVLQSFAPKELAASWDNVGLLIEPVKPRPITHALITNDLTEDVMQEAVDLNADLIISYHPPIFAPLKSLTTKTWKERIAATCLEHKIALYSPHTSFDSVKGGLNDWLVEAFDIKTSEPIEPGVNPETGLGRLCTLKKPISVSDAVNLVKQRINLPHVRLACARREDSMISSVAVCAGAGTSILKGVKADLYITGEMLHHDILDAVHFGAHVILTNHSDSERGFLKVFALKLAKMLGDSVKVSVSLIDADPLNTV